MKLKLIKPMGKSQGGDTIYAADTQAAYLIKQGLAEEHPEADPEPIQTKNQLYKDHDGNYRTAVVPFDYNGDGSEFADIAVDEEVAYTTSSIVVDGEEKPKAGRKPKAKE